MSQIKINFNTHIPVNVSRVTTLLTKGGFEAYLVGGCVRDLIMNREPNDWDITTNAVPEDIVKLFESHEYRVVYENNFGTVALIFEEEEGESSTRVIEITPYRTEGIYTDNRRPDTVAFAKTLDEDLSRRDFTCNALAYDPVSQTLIDQYGGVADIQTQTLRAVGEARERFTEDALRIMRAVRFSAQLNFTLADDMMEALCETSHFLENISWERIRDEFTKIVMTQNIYNGLNLMKDIGIAQYVVPELAEGIGVEQNRSHIYTVWEHNIRAGQTAAEQDWTLPIRLAALFHDCGKPATKRYDKKQKVTTFYGHEVVGARMVKQFLKRLKYPKELSETVVKLVRYHMFFSDPDQITLSAVRRMIRNVGKDHIWDLMNVRRSDRIGMGRPKAAPYRLRMYESMIDEALRDPIDVKMLAMNGDIMIKEMGMKPGREMGWILHALLEEVLDDPSKNNREYLEGRVRELEQLDRETLQKIGEQGKEIQKEADQEAVKHLRHKHKVKFEE
ncbi:CCA tRNA nucleotidyltransferase [Candidatus Nomurabacteria bacterium]|nr:CCA tRNA nucleotidyltransferase [Candidatus Nomurabacteria bacterium]